MANSRTYIENVMYGRTRSVVPEALLLVASLVYRAAIAVRRFAYRTGILQVRRLPVKVVSVGNITLGGTGKTPAAVSIAGDLSDHAPVIVSRGYGRSAGPETAIVSDRSSVLLGPDAAGDEPAMMAQRLKGVPVVVGSDRFQAALLAVERFRPQVVILDDGFQHLGLHRDMNILLVDGTDPFGNGRLFPAGILREPLKELGRADAVLVTRSDRAGDLGSLRKRIGQFTGAPIFTSRHVPLDLVDAATGEKRPLDILQRAHVAAFAGIARPAAFDALLASLGAEIVSFKTYPDHHSYTYQDMSLLVQEAERAAALLVTTEKDGVKLKGMVPAGVWMLRIGLEIGEKDAWENMLRRPR